MCYSGSVYCVCCNREFDNPGPSYVAGCGCTSNKCDDCNKHRPCIFSESKEPARKPAGGACTA